MSLSKATSRIKTGAKELTSLQGLKSVALNTGLGAAVGAIVFLIIRAFMLNIVYAKSGLNWRHEDGDHMAAAV